MTSLCLIIPTWDYDRAIAQVRELRRTGTLDRIVIAFSGADEDSVTHEEYDLDPLNVLGIRQRSSPVEAMNAGAKFASATAADDELLAFIHDDLTISSLGWTAAVKRFFDHHPRCGLAGFGGATGLGTDDIYHSPYQLQQLIRIDYASNADDWQAHGRLLATTDRVAVLDGLALIFRPEAYDAIGGWSACLDRGIPFHMYDAWACLQMARHGWEVWALPVAFHHQGGGTSVKFSAEYEQMVKRFGYENGQALYDDAHETIYREFDDVLPLRV